jgi:Na+/citrate or Na+/malate symporter
VDYQKAISEVVEEYQSKLDTEQDVGESLVNIIAIICADVLTKVFEKTNRHSQ